MRNIIASKRFSKYLIVFEIFAMFWFSDLEKKLEQKLIFFSENFNSEPRLNEVIPNCGELHKKYYCFQKIFQNIW